MTDLRQKQSEPAKSGPATGNDSLKQPQQPDRQSQQQGGSSGQQVSGQPQHDKKGSQQQGSGQPQQDKTGGQQHQFGESGKQFGEGNYAATKDYNQRTKDFVDSGKVPQAARDAAPKTDAESREMLDAERLGKSRAKDENPEVSSPHPHKPGSGPDE